MDPVYQIPDDSDDRRAQQSISNKERSKAFRKRKKKYLEDKIKQVDSLKKEVESLQKENSELKIKIQHLKAHTFKSIESDTAPDHKCDHKRKIPTSLQEQENYLYNTVSKKLKNNPDEVRFSTLEQAYEPVYDWSEQRARLIKKLFQDILDNILGLQSKCFHSAVKEFPLYRFMKKQRKKKRQKKYFDKSKEPQIPQDLDMKIHYSDKFLEMVNENSKPFNTYVKEVRKVAQTLIIQRNKLLNLYQYFKEAMDKTQFLSWYTKADYSNTFKLVNYLQDTKFVQPHFLYDIPKKTHSNSKYEGGELTE
ncbi:unnamed protein product [Moneuplotes crassus]|uniref:BZIP domain-containing protein n=1 Tax=Euplotes crassus TaxID=5936 RepID=A0AAD1XM87_EUPCR|nr:unnamed protein product [Moneuplotes crassus]